MRSARNPERGRRERNEGGFCLTGMSIASLTGCALAASAALWLCILAVL